MDKVRKASYDAIRDAEKLAAPLKKWASLGFLRGFTGIKKEIVPVGSMVLPSTVFLEVAHESLEAADLEPDELTARNEYIDRVEEVLRDRQNKFVEKHYTNFIFGHIVDGLLAFTFIILIASLIINVGPYSPLTIGLTCLMGVKIFFLQLSVNRAIRIAQKAFAMPKDSIVLPWNSQQDH